MDKHEVYVEYTWRDDGIHLRCRGCDLNTVMGDTPTVLELQAAKNEHLMSVQ